VKKKKPQNVEEAKALLWERVEAMGKKREAHRLAERDYFTAREWLQELEAKCRA
jgi:hypothetical protein